MGILQTYRFISSHPLARKQKSKALCRWLRWQIGSRLLGWPVVVPYVNKTRLLVRRGMTGATGNLYCGLHEFNDMAFVLHFLRPEDLFVDVGANIGSYTILASATGASAISFEPVRTSFEALLDNVHINRLHGTVKAVNSAVGRENGELVMTADRDTTNQAIKPGNDYQGTTTRVPVTTLDAALEGKPIPPLIKIDVEGFESEVIAGAHGLFSSPEQLAVIMELNGSGARYGVDEATLHRQMLEFGYKPHAYDPARRNLVDLQGRNMSSGNTLYLKQTAAVLARLKQSPTYEVQGMWV